MNLVSFFLHVILVFGTVFEDAGELCVIEVSFLVNWCLAEKLINLLICETVAHGGQEFTKMVLMDKAFRMRHVRSGDYHREFEHNNMSDWYLYWVQNSGRDLGLNHR